MNVIYAAGAYPAGAAADRLSPRTLLVIGLMLLVAADVALAIARSPLAVFAGTALWGLHMGLTRVSSTLVADAAPAELRGTAFGIFNLVAGIALLIASVSRVVCGISQGRRPPSSPVRPSRPFRLPGSSRSAGNTCRGIRLRKVGGVRRAGKASAGTARPVRRRGSSPDILLDDPAQFAGHLGLHAEPSAGTRRRPGGAACRARRLSGVPRARRLQQAGIERDIDDVVHDGRRLQVSQVDVQRRLSEHAEGRGVHEEVRLRQQPGQFVPAMRVDAGAEMRCASACACSRVRLTRCTSKPRCNRP